MSVSRRALGAKGGGGSNAKMREDRYSCRLGGKLRLCLLTSLPDWVVSLPTYSSTRWHLLRALLRVVGFQTDRKPREGGLPLPGMGTNQAAVFPSVK